MSPLSDTTFFINFDVWSSRTRPRPIPGPRPPQQARRQRRQRRCVRLIPRKSPIIPDRARETLKAVAAETVAISQSGVYTSAGGAQVDFTNQLHRCIRETVLYRPDQRFVPAPPRDPGLGRIEVTAESVFSAARRLSAGHPPVAVLNFASATHPGGGFLNGAQAQEEAIARASALYVSIEPQREMYNWAKSNPNPVFSDYMIYSPAVPFFRDDDGLLMDEPFYASVITAAAVNAAGCKGKVNPKAIFTAMKNRMRKIILVAAERGNKSLVLGAFGCGVFGNDPRDIAPIEKQLLVDERLREHFDVIANPILGGRDKTIPAFQGILGPFQGG
jgi:uncharacterized protein (TIGR02452 family)